MHALRRLQRVPLFNTPITRLRVTLFAAFLVAVLLSALPLHASGVVTNCTEANLRNALAGGGTVTLACDGAIVLTNTLTIDRDTTLDGTGRNVVLSGGNAVRILDIDPGVHLTLINLTIADGRHTGTNAANFTDAGHGFGGGIYNKGGSVALISEIKLVQRADFSVFLRARPLASVSSTVVRRE
jgi:hypothetical protein